MLALLAWHSLNSTHKALIYYTYLSSTCFTYTGLTSSPVNCFPYLAIALLTYSSLSLPSAHILYLSGTYYFYLAFTCLPSKCLASPYSRYLAGANLLYLSGDHALLYEHLMYFTRHSRVLLSAYLLGFLESTAS